MNDEVREGKSLHKRVLEFEKGIIAEALDAAGGHVTEAARTLGLTHQGLCYMINNRHKDLLAARLPIRARRRSLISKGKRGKRK